MSMQVSSIILYNLKGEIRQLTFDIGKVNIITGKSSTGKSAIIAILDYCLGGSRFKVPEGTIRETVAWYAVVYQLNETQVLIAKPSPSKTAISQNQVYYEVGKEISIPPFSNLIPNSNDEAIKQVLSGLLGISPNRNIPPEGQTREPLEANIRHTLFYLFQEQNVVANKDLLFYRQQDQYMPQTIKDTLPYFLGAIQEDRLRLQTELQRASRNLRLAERELNEAGSISTEKAAKADSLVAEAQQVGLIDKSFSPETFEETLQALKETLSWQPKISQVVEDDRIPILQK